MAKKCSGKNKRGAPCGGYARPGGDFCFAHDPERAAARAEARKLGGYGRRTGHAGDLAAVPHQVKSLADVRAILDYSLLETLALDNSVLRTRALIALANEYTHVLEISDLEERVRRLEERSNVQTANRADGE